MNESTRELLERPFPPEHIRTRKGSFGRELAYAETHTFIARLNEAFAGDWSFDVVEHRILDDEVVVLGRLTAASVTKTAFGSSVVTTARETGDRVSIGDDLKAAASDALKKCSSLLGLGLHLYGQVEGTQAEEPRKTSAVPFPSNNGGSNGRVLTKRQYGAILALAEKAGYSEAQVKTKVLDLHGVPLDQLGRREASELITSFNNGNGRAAGGAA